MRWHFRTRLRITSGCTLCGQRMFGDWSCLVSTISGFNKCLGGRIESLKLACYVPLFIGGGKILLSKFIVIHCEDLWSGAMYCTVRTIIGCNLLGLWGMHHAVFRIIAREFPPGVTAHVSDLALVNTAPFGGIPWPPGRFLWFSAIGALTSPDNFWPSRSRAVIHLPLAGTAVCGAYIPVVAGDLPGSLNDLLAEIPSPVQVQVILNRR